MQGVLGETVPAVCMQGAAGVAPDPLAQLPQGLSRGPQAGGEKDTCAALSPEG